MKARLCSVARSRTLPAPSIRSGLGIGVIYQEFNLVPGLTARENIFLGRERTTAGFIHRGEEIRRARELFARTGIEIDPETPCRMLTVAQQQIVEIAKALAQDVRILVMDEPSATLTPSEVERLFVVIRELQRQGVGIIYISHRLEEIYEIADRVTVIRDGQYVGSKPVSEVNRGQLIEMMVGRTLEQEFPSREVELGPERLVVKNLSRGRRVKDVSFSVRAGEIVALAGLVGRGPHRDGPAAVRGRQARKRRDLARWQTAPAALPARRHRQRHLPAHRRPQRAGG